MWNGNIRASPRQTFCVAHFACKIMLTFAILEQCMEKGTTSYCYISQIIYVITVVTLIY